MMDNLKLGKKYWKTKKEAQNKEDWRKINVSRKPAKRQRPMIMKLLLVVKNIQ